MKSILKHFVIDTVCLYIISQFISGMVFSEGPVTLALTGAVLSLTTLIIKPIINILLLPINLITFGLFKWVAYAVTLYLVLLLVPGFEITGFHFSGIVTYWFSLPAIDFSGAIAIVAFSFVISLLTSIIFWIMK